MDKDKKIKKIEKQIMDKSLKIALLKQDLSLQVLNELTKDIKNKTTKKINKNKIANELFNIVKNQDNEIYWKLVKANKRDKIKIRKKIRNDVLKELIKIKGGKKK